MLRSVDARWLALLSMVAALFCLGALNVAISGMSVDISPLAVESPRHTAVPAAKDKNQPIIVTDWNLPETLVRPVFSPTRRDFVPPPEPVAMPAAPIIVEAPPSQPPSPPNIKLRGTRTVSGRFSALIATDEKNVNWFAEGERVLGWTIVSIEADRMSLSTGTSSAVFSLYDTGTKRADGPAN